MSIDITGKNVKLWVNNVQTRDGRSFPTYNIGIGKKNKDGSFTNMYLKVRFGKDIHIPENIANGTQMDFDGFFTVDTYTNRNGEEVKTPAIFITNARFADSYDIDGFSQAEADIPF